MAQWTASDGRPVVRKPVTDWRIRKSFGFGAGQLRLAPHPASLVCRPAPALAGLDAVAAEWRELGWTGSFRSALRPAAGVGLGMLLLLALSAEFRDRPVDFTDLRIVDFEVPEPPIVEPPAPAPSLAARAASTAAPAPAPVEVIPEPAPVVALVAPEMPRIAAISMPEIVDPVRPQAPAPLPPPGPVRETPRPQVHIEALERPALPHPQLAALPTRTVTERPRSAVHTAVAIDPVATRSETRPPRSAPIRTLRARPSLAAAPGRAPVSLAPIAVAGSPGGPPPRKSRRSTGTARPTPPRRASSARPAVLAAVAFGSGPAEGATVEAAHSFARNPRSELAVAGGARNEVDSRLAGVPLSALTACVSDREEDALKLNLLAAVSHTTECSNRAGRYHFVETKNLNAFLMWIERSPRRAPADRCVELRHAIACLQAAKAYGGST